VSKVLELALPYAQQAAWFRIVALVPQLGLRVVPDTWRVGFMMLDRGRVVSTWGVKPINSTHRLNLLVIFLVRELRPMVLSLRLKSLLAHLGCWLHSLQR